MSCHSRLAQICISFRKDPIPADVDSGAQSPSSSTLGIFSQHQLGLRWQAANRGQQLHRAHEQTIYGMITRGSPCHTHFMASVLDQKS